MNFWMWFFCSPSLLTQHPAPCRVWGWPPAVPQQCARLWAEPHMAEDDYIPLTLYFTLILQKHPFINTRGVGKQRRYSCSIWQELGFARWIPTLLCEVGFPKGPRGPWHPNSVVCRPGHSKQSNQCPSNSVPLISKLPPAQLGARGCFSGLAHCYVK